MRKDRCRTCGGNGDTCTLVNSTYTKDYRRYGEIVISTDSVMRSRGTSRPLDEL